MTEEDAREALLDLGGCVVANKLCRYLAWKYLDVSIGQIQLTMQRASDKGLIIINEDLSLQIG